MKVLHDERISSVTVSQSVSFSTTETRDIFISQSSSRRCADCPANCYRASSAPEILRSSTRTQEDSLIKLPLITGKGEKTMHLFVEENLSTRTIEFELAVLPPDVSVLVSLGTHGSEFEQSHRPDPQQRKRDHGVQCPSARSSASSNLQGTETTTTDLRCGFSGSLLSATLLFSTTRHPHSLAPFRSASPLFLSRRDPTCILRTSRFREAALDRNYHRSYWRVSPIPPPSPATPRAYNVMRND